MKKSSRTTATDQDTTLQELKDLVEQFCKERDWDQFHDPKNLAEAMTIEAAELLEIFRWKDGESSLEVLKDKRGRERVADELSDVLYFILRFAQLYEIDLSSSFRKKLAKNARRYPIEKARGRAEKYTELEEK